MGVFQAGGDLRAGAFYAERAADEVLWRAMSSGGLAYVLAPRQIGKSSLARRVGRRLTDLGWAVAHVDMNLVGAQSTDQGQWAFGLAAEIAGQLGWQLAQLEVWWDQADRMSPIHRLIRLIRGVSAEQRLAVFFDEIDGVMSLPFDPDDFFAALRGLHNDDTGNQLALCLLGVATPGELIRDESRTPFNVGTAVRLEDLTRAELAPLEAGVAGWGAPPEGWLDAVYAWTHGHPYMTQRVLAMLEEDREEALDDEEDWPTASVAETVDGAVERAFLRDGRSVEANLIYAEQRIDGVEPMVKVRRVRLYQRVLRGERLAADVAEPDHRELLLAGLVAREPGDTGEVLRVRNRVFATVFDEAWVAGKESLGTVFLALRRWVAGGRRDGDLLAGSSLDEALGWYRDHTELLDTEGFEFIQASEHARQELAQAAAELEVTKAKLEAETLARAAAEDLAREGRRRTVAERSVLALALVVVCLVAAAVVWDRRSERIDAVRKSALVSLKAQAAAQAAVLELRLQEHEWRLAQLAGRATMVLDPTSRWSSSAGSGLVGVGFTAMPSARYGGESVDLSAPVTFYPKDLLPERREEASRRLGQLTRAMRGLVLPGPDESARGRPLFAYVVGGDGVAIKYPRTRADATRHDFAEEPWYRAEYAGRFRASWSVLPSGRAGPGKTVLCRSRLHDRAALVGTTAIELELDALVDDLLEVDDLPGAYAYLLTPDQILAESDHRSPHLAQAPRGYRTVRRGLEKGADGALVVEPDGVVVAWSRLHNDWWYVLSASLDDIHGVVGDGG